MNIKYILCMGLFICSSIYAEFNLIQVDENPDFIELGYRNTISDKFTRIITGKDYNPSYNNFRVGGSDYEISFYATQKNDNKLKGSDFYYIVYEPEFVFKNKKYVLPIAFENLEGLGASVIYDDKNISIFTTEMYKPPVTNRSELTRFYGNTYFFNKKI